MIPFILLGGLLTAAVIVVAITFWDQIKKFLQQALKKITQLFSAAVQGVSVYIRSGGNWREGIKAAYCFYRKDAKGLWQENVVTKTIVAEELPDNIRWKIESSNEAIDITKELQLRLEQK